MKRDVEDRKCEQIRVNDDLHSKEYMADTPNWVLLILCLSFQYFVELAAKSVFLV